MAADGYSYGGKTHDCSARIAEVVRALPSVRRTVLIPYLSAAATAEIRNVVGWDAFLSSASGGHLQFEPLPFNHPLYILYSSGTTGVPKCIVHGAGGTLIQHLKEHQLHCDIGAGDRVFYFTTCGWMMWNWLVSALASGATLVLYDGSPFYPDGQCALRSGRRDRHDVLRDVAQIHRRRGEGGPRAEDVASAGDRAHDHVDRIAAGTGRVRFRLRENQTRRPPGLDLRRDRHRRTLWRRESERRRLARRDSGAGARDAGRGVRRGRPLRAASEGRARLHDAVSLDARGFLERPRRAASIARRTSNGFRASGVMATTSS